MRLRSMNSSGVTREFRQRRERDVVGDRDVHQQAFLAPVLGDEGNAAADACARRVSREPAASPTTISPES